MYIKNKYSIKLTLFYSRKYLVFGLVYSFIIFLFFRYFSIPLYLPWEPLTLIGIAVSFYIGFKNNNAYDRTWEARKIWGGIVNDSRSFATNVLSLIQGKNQENIHQKLLYRHIAWLKLLQVQLRMTRSWEAPKQRLDIFFDSPDEEFHEEMAKRLKHLLCEEDLKKVRLATNPATQILNSQFQEIKALKKEGYLNDYSQVHLTEVLNRFYDGQGKSERIKNFPLPRQYASTSYWLTIIYVTLIPFGFVSKVQDFPTFYWVSFLLSGLTIWIFLLMEHIGDNSENPFQGALTDVPITSISNGIETDLLEMIGEEATNLDQNKIRSYNI